MENMDTQFTTMANQNVAPRKLYMDFDLYTEGDTVFKKELLTLMIKNIQDFQKALADVFVHKTPEIFLRAAHKVKVSISMLNDQELSETLKMIERDIVANRSLEHSHGLYSDFNNICDGIVTSLETELNK